MRFRVHQEVVEESFLPTVRTLMNAPATSPLAEVDINNVVELLVDLTRPSVLTKPTPNTGVRRTPVPSLVYSLPTVFMSTNTARHSQTFRFTVGHILEYGVVCVFRRCVFMTTWRCACVARC